LILGRGKIFLFSVASRPALGPTYLPIQWVLGGGGELFWVKEPGVKLTTHLCLIPRTRMVELYLYSLRYLHGIVIN
jgi:hypothetical protein